MTNTQVSTIAERFGISKTMAQLMLKNNCSTPDEYRQLRKQKKSEAPKKEAKEKPSKPSPVQKGKKK
jgi:hypothetical protein